VGFEMPYDGNVHWDIGISSGKDVFGSFSRVILDASGVRLHREGLGGVSIIRGRVRVVKACCTRVLDPYENDVSAMRMETQREKMHQ